MSLKKVANQIEQLRGRYEPTSDEAVLLGIFRDMAVFASRKSWPKVKTLALSIEDELMDDAELSASVAEELVKVARELVAAPAKVEI